MLHFIAKRYGKNNSTNPMVAGAIGAAAGIALGAIAGAYLSDESKRGQIHDKIDDMNTKAKNTYFDVKHRILSHADKNKDKMDKKSQSVFA